jgi:hypothetical protein
LEQFQQQQQQQAGEAGGAAGAGGGTLAPKRKGAASADIFFPAFYFHHAAMWAIERRICAQRLGVFRSATGSALAIETAEVEIVVEQHPALFLGQLSMISVTAGGADAPPRTYLAARPGAPGQPIELAADVGTGSVAAPAGAEVVPALQLLLETERAFDHSREVLRLLALARGARALQANADRGAHQSGAQTNRPRLEMYALSLEVAECVISFIYRYILRESRSQFDSLPLISLTICL